MLEALVLQKEDKDGRLILSKKRAQYERAWGTIEKIKEEEGVVSGPVIEVVKGGLILDIGLRGFLPASLVDLRRVRDLQPYVGRTIECKIIELDKNRNNVVLSRRAYLEETQREQRDEFLANLKPGEVRQGVVSLGRELRCVRRPRRHGRTRPRVRAVVEARRPPELGRARSATRSRCRCSTSTSPASGSRSRSRRPSRTRGRSSPPVHQVGELVYGRVTKLVPFGAFVQVGDGIEGLVHISEMAVHHVEAPEQVVTPGEELWVKIIDIDLDRRRISLSIKQAAEGGVVAAEYQDQFGEHAYDEAGQLHRPRLHRGRGRRRRGAEAAGAPSDGDARRSGGRGRRRAATRPKLPAPRSPRPRLRPRRPPRPSGGEAAA